MELVSHKYQAYFAGEHGHTSHNEELANMSKTAIYLRCSADSQDTESQRMLVNRYLEGHQIRIAPDMLFEDHGKSGKDLDRPALSRLQQAVFNGEVKRIIFPSVDRFARTMIDGMVALDAWMKAGVTLVFVRESIEVNPKDWAGQIIMKIIVSLCLALAEQERERITARRSAGFAVARERTRKAQELAAQDRDDADMAQADGKPLHAGED
jgi:DNA invertase Pin-like site-specific DNA recombinase